MATRAPDALSTNVNARGILDAMTATSTTSTMTLSLPYLPSSANRDMYAHWSRRRRAKQRLQRDLEALLMAAGVPRGVERVDASAVLVVPDRRRRDGDNYRWPLSKALGDALVAGGWLVDDTPEHFAFGELVFEPMPGQALTCVTLGWGRS